MIILFPINFVYLYHMNTYSFDKKSFRVQLLRQKLLHPQSIDKHTIECILNNDDYQEHLPLISNLTSRILVNPILLSLLLVNK